MIGHYWALTGGNILAMPPEFVITVAAGLLFGKPLRRLWHRVFGERADIEDIRRAAAAAHRIAADLHEKLTGEAHPEAPAKTESEAR